jgi:succinylarginine dihydrolase
MPEIQFDGLVGPTHGYAGLSPGNTASARHEGSVSNPRAAAKEGIAKMRFVRGLGVAQAVLPPHDRPSLRTLRALGFAGRDEEVIAAAAAFEGGWLLRACSSASAMWTANAATVAPSRDAADGRMHLAPANLSAMFHRSIEAPTTTRVLRAVFADAARFVVHDPLPAGAYFADEGAANHLRLETGRGVAHVLAWGRRAWGRRADAAGAGVEPGREVAPRAHPARQTLEASEAVARLLGLSPDACLFPQQDPSGIDAGAFHTDVLAVGNGRLVILHELAFADAETLVAALRERLGDELVVERVTNAELPVARAVAAYPFNSQVLSLPGGAMIIVAPEDARDDPASRAVLERIAAGKGPVRSVHYVGVRQSMRNGGGPACLRLRVDATDEELGALSGRVVLDDALATALTAWIERHYRDRLAPADLADPSLARESMEALDALSQLLQLGSVYDFQRALT